jgi:DNA repair protein SbcD/Mre11
MRIIHLADTHLGYRQFAGKLDPTRGLNQREVDVYNAWHQAIDIAIERRPDVVLHAGDLFDSARPSPRAVAEALDGFLKLREADIPTIVIAGNHSTPRFRSGGSVFEILERFGIEAVWNGPRTIQVDGIAIHALPHEPDAEKLLCDIRELRPDGSASANVLLLHAGLEGVRQDYGEVNEIELDPGVLAAVEYDYIALGHLHRYQVPQVNAIYSGSLERLDFADLEGAKGVLEIALSAGAGSDGFVVRHELAVRPMLDVPVDCRELDPTEVLAAVETAVAGQTVDDAVIRLRLESIARDIYHALDFAAIDELLAPALHHVLLVGRSGLMNPSAPDERDLSFAAFARQHIPRGVDEEAVLAIAQRHLADATAEETEADR